MRRAALVLAGCCMLGVNPAHPFHASTADVSVASGGVARIVVRVFTDDLTTAAGAKADGQRAYIASRFQFRNRQGERVALMLDSLRAEGPATRVTGSAQVGNGSEVFVWHGVLLEHFGDQVNVVRVHTGGQHRTLVFSAGDAAQALR